ncbi:hypothetical protein Pelo_6519 [Pelomyxa schiedti]|nr:hypothetical protein Pelo_6519 [Pelomyxa schiedti]
MKESKTKPAIVDTPVTGAVKTPVVASISASKQYFSRTNSDGSYHLVSAHMLYHNRKLSSQEEITAAIEDDDEPFLSHRKTTATATCTTSTAASSPLSPIAVASSLERLTERIRVVHERSGSLFAGTKLMEAITKDLTRVTLQLPILSQTDGALTNLLHTHEQILESMKKATRYFHVTLDLLNKTYSQQVVGTRKVF